MESDMLTKTIIERRGALRFHRDLVGWILVILNLLAVVNSTYYFIGQLKVGVDGWIMLNTCAPSIIIFAIGFLLGSPIVMLAASVLMFRYGTLGLLVFSWEGFNIIPQIGHILMTLAVAYALFDILRRRDWASLAFGLLAGLAILVPLMLVQNAWLKARPGLLEQLFQGALTPTGP
jgi:hypothetical protein